MCWTISEAVRRGVATASWYELAQEVARTARLEMDLSPIPTEASKAVAERPAYSVLDLAGTEAKRGRPMRSWSEALRAHLDEAGR